jgi:hypothetical protein
MRPTIEQVLKAVETMGAPGIMKFFPCDALGRELITDELYMMVPSVEALQWLVSIMVRSVGEWQSLREIRALLGTRFKPLDAARFPTPDCSIPGFTPADSERLCPAAEAQQQLEARELEARLLPAAEKEANRKLLTAAFAVAHCQRCGNSGLVESPSEATHWQWCVCVHARRKHEQEPGAVDRANAAVVKIRKLSRPAAVPGSKFADPGAGRTGPERSAGGPALKSLGVKTYI